MKREALISALGSCINACNHCADACLEEDDVKKMVECIRIDRVCAEICSSLSQILHTKYANIDGLIKYCMSVCKECAAICGAHQLHHCQECAKACKACIDACASYLKA